MANNPMTNYPITQLPIPSSVMHIDQLLRTVESYLKSRAAILRVLNDRKFKSSELEAILNVPYAVMFRRRQNAAHWRSSELRELADMLGMSGGAIVGVESLANQLQDLPTFVRVPLLKEARIDSHRLATRAKDYDCWQYDELQQLASVLRRWQDTNLVDQLMVSRQ